MPNAPFIVLFCAVTNKSQGIAQETGRISDQTFKDAIAATEQGLVDVVRREVRQNPNITAVGSCCLVALVWNGALYVANLGDSRAVIGRLDDVSNRIVAEQLTKDDNLRDQSIREALMREHSEEQDLVVEVNGAYRLKGKLQLSKAIGDAYLKFPEYYRTPGNPRYHLREPVRRAVLSADPTVVTRVLQPHHRFLICASDGLWDHISSERAVEIVHKHPQEGIARRLLKAAIKMACRKSKERYTYDQIKAFGSNQSRRDIHDDITIVVIYFDHDRGYDANVPGLSIRGFRNSHLPPRFNLQGVE
ncbi:putative protein phosphatase 2C 43 [Morus notabilis]|uniref:PPM-type phosphatase domain-containing protein n=1 Tax=Morus notabilis TaxID=981085 RepID=W9SF61_9ROSA|nr:probable protein phosphatase 2C 43 [Morus notabilis]EXC03927.1 putative protein phosphatase 2C 43 [Morus notabilis]